MGAGTSPIKVSFVAAKKKNTPHNWKKKNTVKNLRKEQQLLDRFVKTRFQTQN